MIPPKAIIPFNKPFMTGKELTYISQANSLGQLAGDGSFTQQCHSWLKNKTQCYQALLTHSCTAALEMAALLCDIQPGDEVIMPSYTFVSTANAFVLRGAVPVFVDIREDTLNLDEKLIEQAITNRTRAIVPVHYAGIACEMDTILEIAKRYGLQVIEDAAQGVMSFYKGKALGSIGDLGAFSFHETKNIISGEGGALLVNSERLVQRAEIIREKGTNRSRFFRGEVDKYTWQDLGSSYLPGEIIAAFLFAQLQEADRITQERLNSWNFYHKCLATLENKEYLRRPIVPEFSQHNGHMYYVLLHPTINRQLLLSQLKKYFVHSVFHYVPLHLSPAGQQYGRTNGALPVTQHQSERIIRLPLWMGLTPMQIEYIVHILTLAIKEQLEAK